MLLLLLPMLSLRLLVVLLLVRVAVVVAVVQLRRLGLGRFGPGGRWRCGEPLKGATPARYEKGPGSLRRCLETNTKHLFVNINKGLQPDRHRRGGGVEVEVILRSIEHLTQALCHFITETRRNATEATHTSQHSHKRATSFAFPSASATTTCATSSRS